MDQLQIAVERGDIQVDIDSVVPPAFDNYGTGERYSLCLCLREIDGWICQVSPAATDTATAVELAEYEVWLLDPDNVGRAGAEGGEQIIFKADIEEVKAYGRHHADWINAFDDDGVRARGFDFTRRD
jgi:hypothetical protein